MFPFGVKKARESCHRPPPPELDREEFSTEGYSHALVPTEREGSDMNWNWYIDVLKNRYAQFDGRAHREEFWMFALVNFLISIGVAIVAVITHLWILRALYGLAVIVPGLAVGARRLHDTNKSGWLQLLLLIPLIGLIIMIVFWAQEGVPGPNQYGADPRGTVPPPAPAAAA
jgi:uncharacterized membrane protein YhaH (DUF805 family)